ncbi:MAG: SUMF1/EgtB/PvdO family nonheme iron enzyme [Rhodomicrobium sp.]
MTQIFVSHSSEDNALAIALRDWLVSEGWSDLFLDLDPERGIAAGERWEKALNEAARRCEAVIFLISKSWLGSHWCMNELMLSRRLNKRIFGVLIEEGLSLSDLPNDIIKTWQVVNLASGRDHRQFRVVMPLTGEELHVTFSAEGLTRLKAGLQRAGLRATYFNWPPENDPMRPPYRGLRPLEADDAGIFFGREAPVLEAIERLRGLTEAAPPRIMVILGASGSGKSSFLRAGLLPRLGRDPQTFLPLQAIRPERAPLSGEAGLVAALAAACAGVQLKVPRAEIRAAVDEGAQAVKALLRRIQAAARLPAMDPDVVPKPPTIVIPIDQGEELFQAEAQEEAQRFLALLRALLIEDDPAVVSIFTIRSENYERLQNADELSDIHKVPLDLGPMPKGSYVEVVKGPAQRLAGTDRAFKIDDALVDALLADIETGGAKDALPLLAFTLERLYGEYGSTGHLTLDQYVKLGRVRGSIEAAVEQAFKLADNDPRIPRDRQARLTLLRRALIPWLAGIDIDTKAPRRRVARQSEIPAEARPLIDLLVEQRLLSTDVSKDTGEKTIEPAHEALLRRWGLLQGWLEEDTGLLSVLDGIKRASRDWAANLKESSWLAHIGERYSAAARLLKRPDLVANLDATDQEYVASCSKAVQAAADRERAILRFRQRMRASVIVLLLGIIAGLVGWINQQFIKDQVHWVAVERPFRIANVDPYALTPERERALKPGDTFQECSKGNCPEMMVVPAGSFVMGSPPDEPGRNDNEGPQHVVTIANPFAVSVYKVTFADWDVCAHYGDCRSRPQISDASWGRGRRPVIYVSLDDIQTYIGWLSKMTGKPYRLLTEAEYEYAARAGSAAAYPWGKEIGKNNAHCMGCGTRYDGGPNDRGPNGGQTLPVDEQPPNSFGLYGMAGNVWEMVQDCYHASYEVNTPSGKDIAPNDGSAWTTGDCKFRASRGGSWAFGPDSVRSASRTMSVIDGRNFNLGFRLARTVNAP